MSLPSDSAKTRMTPVNPRRDVVVYPFMFLLDDIMRAIFVTTLALIVLAALFGAYRKSHDCISATGQQSPAVKGDGNKIIYSVNQTK